ncbi:hypothetical protein Ocin01_11533 [Orchesella cincta]|uniref:F-box domain-containing protein n=1 Tax=Orchesella cincta TaxID=48709 RepID=A0A1D2MQG2_ORCCI|nr:hypothetical protein Ocin01_11533 [Orchesella cincta]
MEIVASNLPVQDLLRCRLVCKLWASEMAQYLTKRKALVVAYEDCSEAKELVKKKQDGKFVNISTLCVLEIPITSQIIVDVVKNFGETLSGLKLDDCNPDAKDLYSILIGLPCLEVLSFKQTGTRRVEETEETPSTLDGLTSQNQALRMTCLKKLIWEEMQPVKYFERIIQMFPCLEDLELLCWSKPDPVRVEGLRLDSLKHLSITCDNNFSEQHFQALAKLKLKLKKLSLHDVKPGGRKKMRGLKLFLESVSKTLVEMNLNGNGRIIANLRPNTFVTQATPFPIDFPGLKTLNIDCSLMADLKMLNHIPKLKKLECKFQDWKGWWHLLNAKGVPQVHAKVEEMSLGAIDSGCLGKIADCFTSVTKLYVSEDRIDDVAFRVIAKQMQQLTHLRITTSTNRDAKKLKLTDSGFTGISLEDCQKLSSAAPETIDRDYIDRIRINPSIGSLKGLYSLELACSEIFITDIAVLYGIAELKRVSTITLPKCKLTNASLEVLGDLPSLLVLELHKSCGVTPEGVASLRTKKKDLIFNLYSDLNSRIFS